MGSGASPDDSTTWASSLPRLHTMVLAQELDPPVDTRGQLLPFERLAWENFERLCLRLALERGAVDHAVDYAAGDHQAGQMSAHQAQGGLYGTRGQDQLGIDLYVRLPAIPAAAGDPAVAPRYLSLQSRRIASLTAAKLKKAVNDFLGGKWASASDVFVYATSLPTVRIQLADEIAVQTKRLLARGIKLEVWDAEALSVQLKSAQRHVLVDDFFGRAWVGSFCGPEAADALGRRLDATQVGAFREKLGGFYRAFFGVADPGTAALQRPDAPRLELRERFVLPDLLISTGAQALSASGESSAQSAPDAASEEYSSDAETYNPFQQVGNARSAGASKRALRRRSVSWLMGSGPATEGSSTPTAGCCGKGCPGGRWLDSRCRRRPFTA